MTVPVSAIPFAVVSSAMKILAASVMMPVIGPRDHSALLRNEEFLGILANKRGSQIDATLGNNNLKKILEEVIRLIDAEFEDSQQ